ncbi:hypothetical protein BJY01DRAFT_251116 [Aspergillus pseudoustus]|uniref:Uncharacterized protein n=1 Tax=Aspergillus pseudoustus TaxID=1810923 RepID=A0ABR4JGK6_9EURO
MRIHHYSYPTPPGVTWHPETTGLNLPGNPNPDDLPRTHTWRQPLHPGSTTTPASIQAHRLYALPAWSIDGMAARFAFHTTSDRDTPPRIRWIAPRTPIYAPARLPPIVQLRRHDTPWQTQTRALLKRSKSLVAKVPGVFFAVTAPFMTDMIVRYIWGDKFYYIFPFWI